MPIIKTENLEFSYNFNSRFENKVIKNINISDEKTKLRIMELGLTVGSKVLVKHKSVLKNILLLMQETLIL